MDQSTNGSKRFSKIENKELFRLKLSLVGLKFLVEFLRAQYSDRYCLLIASLTKLDNAYKWAQEWLLKLNIDKCLVMHYGLSNNKYLLHINGKQLVKSDLKEIQASSVLKCDIDMIEQVQQRATKLISAIRNLSYENRLRVNNFKRQKTKRRSDSNV